MQKLPIDQIYQLIFSQVTLPSSLHAEQIHKNYQTILLTSWKNKIWKIWSHATLLIFKQEEGMRRCSHTDGAALSPISAKNQKPTRKQVAFHRWSVWHMCGLWLKHCLSWSLVAQIKILWHNRNMQKEKPVSCANKIISPDTQGTLNTSQ